MTVDVVPVPEPKLVKNRFHLDLHADGTTSAGELGRLTALGARHIDIGQGPDAQQWVLSDPEGNEFCLCFRSVQEAEQPPARPVPSLETFEVTWKRSWREPAPLVFDLRNQFPALRYWAMMFAGIRPRELILM